MHKNKLVLAAFVGLSSLSLIFSQLIIIDKFDSQIVEEFYKTSVFSFAFISSVYVAIWKPNVGINDQLDLNIQWIIMSVSLIFLTIPWFIFSSIFAGVISLTVLQLIANFLFTKSSTKNTFAAFFESIYSLLSLIVIWIDDFLFYILLLCALRLIILFLFIDYKLPVKSSFKIENIFIRSKYFIVENMLLFGYGFGEKFLFLYINSFSFTVYSMINKLNGLLSTLLLGGNYINGILIDSDKNRKFIAKYKLAALCISVIFVILWLILLNISKMKIQFLPDLIIENNIEFSYGVLILPASLFFAIRKREFLFSGRTRLSLFVAILNVLIVLLLLIIIISFSLDFRCYLLGMTLISLILGVMVHERLIKCLKNNLYISKFCMKKSGE